MNTGMPKTVIYDLGANTGDDIAYYLMKADLVVAVEAHPQLVDQIRARYADAIAQDQLRVEHCVLVAGTGGEPVTFHINRHNHRMSRFPEPTEAFQYALPSHFDKVVLPSLGLVDLIARHGAPHYMKLDLENYDAVVLRALFENGIFPPLISAEAFDAEILMILIALGGYNSFKFIDGSQVGRDFADHPVQTRDGPARFSFPDHAAGPFGDDLPGQWRDADAFFRHLGLRQLGWKDIHASRIHPPVPVPNESLIDFLINERTPAVLKGPARVAFEMFRRLAAKRVSWPKFETGPASA